MKTIYKYVFINSTLLFVIASILEMTLHEFGHFFASFLVHAQNISIHHNYTSNTDTGLPLLKTLFIKGAGPFISLVIGVLFHLICSMQTKRNTLFLFNVYMALFGYIGFFGYLLIAPMFQGGDTGYICYALGFPIWVTVALSLVGIITLYFLTNRLIKYFVEMGSKEIINDAGNRRKFIHSLILYPLFIGLILTTLLNLPIPVFISLIAPICSPFTFMFGFDNALHKKYSIKTTNHEFEQFNKLNAGLIILFAIIIVINRLLVYGIYVN